MKTEDILHSLTKVKMINNNSWQACCPSHNDKNPSMRITDTGDKTLVKCWAGCSITDIANAMGLDIADFFHEKREKAVNNFNITYKKYDEFRRDRITVILAQQDKLKGLSLTDKDRDYANQAYKRLKQCGKDITDIQLYLATGRVDTNLNSLLREKQ